MVINDNKGQTPNPEKPQENLEKTVQRPIETSEVASKTTQPQPIPKKDDKANVQNIQQNLRNAQPQPQAKPVNPSSNVSSVQTPKTDGNDDSYIKAAENVIEKDKDDPYKEEEDHKDVQIQYLHDRFGKNIKKS